MPLCSRVDRVAAALEADRPEGFKGRYSREWWTVIATAVFAAERGLCDAHVMCLNGGWDGYKATCRCGWEGKVREGKPVARRDAIDHERGTDG